MAHITPISLILAATVSPAAIAQPISASFDSPSRDRWSYPFNFSPGVRSVATVFGATIAGPGFDDFDAEFIVGFDTGGQIPAGEPAANYTISSVRLTASIAAGDQMTYDPTHDDYRTFFLEGDPELLADTDPGRPVGVFPTAYRNGYDLLTWEEFSAFGDSPAVEPAQGSRNILPASYAADGSFIDESNYIKERREVFPAAIGTVFGLTPGTLIPQDATMEFELDLTDPGLDRFIRESLAAGRLNLAVCSLHFASGGPDGGTGEPQYPAFYTRDDALAAVLGLVPTLQITVEVGSPIDFNGDGIIDNGDIGAFVGLFLTGDLSGDINGDGVLDNGDIGAFVELFLASAG